MAQDNNQQQGQQQQQQKGGGGQQKSTSGIQLGVAIDPKDLSRETLSGGFAILALGTLGTLALAHVIQPIRKHLFGITTEFAPAINPNDIVSTLKSPEFKEGQKTWMMKELFGTMGTDTKAKAKEWLANQQ